MNVMNMTHPKHRTTDDRKEGLKKRLANVEASIAAQRERAAGLTGRQKEAALDNLGHLLASRDMLADQLTSL